MDGSDLVYLIDLSLGVITYLRLLWLQDNIFGYIRYLAVNLSHSSACLGAILHVAFVSGPSFVSVDWCLI